MANEVLEPLALRFPMPHPGCQCAICTRAGWSEAQRAIRDNVPSIFQRHKLVRQAPYLPPAQPGSTPAPLPKRIPLYDYDLTDAEHAAFAQQQPQLALHTIPPQSQQQPWLKAALKVTRQLAKLKAAAPFLAAVDPVALQLPDYWDVVKHPMDLATVERKLAEEPSPYTEPAQWESDMRQIFHNANLCQPTTTAYKPHAASLAPTITQSCAHCLAVAADVCCSYRVDRQQTGALCICRCPRLLHQV